jgi:guanidinopropionase
MVDPAKLAAWRARFSNDRPHQTEAPAFRKAASLGFHESGRRKLPYADIPTLLGAPYRPDAPESPDFGGLQVALVGVPMDLAVTNRAGARLGPRAIRNIERIGPMHHAHGIAPMAELRVADVGDVPFRSRFSLEQSLEDIEAFHSRIVAAGVAPLSAGGDHSISYPILRAIGRSHPVGMGISTRIVTPAAPMKAAASTTAARSARRCSMGCWTRSAPSRSASAAAVSICGNSPSPPA